MPSGPSNCCASCRRTATSLCIGWPRTSSVAGPITVGSSVHRRAITALGPVAERGDGHNLLDRSGVGSPLGPPLFLFLIGQLLHPVGLRPRGGGFFALVLRVGQLGIGPRRLRLLGCANLVLLLALRRLDCTVALRRSLVSNALGVGSLV